MKYQVLIWLLLAPISLLAQVREDFSDNNLHKDPLWLGDTADFTFTTDESLRLNAPNNASPVRLFTKTSNKDSITWEFWVNLDFSPSNSNRLKVFLGANDSTFDQGFQGYYLLIGENGTDDGIDLFRQDGNSNQLILKGKDGFINKGPTPFNIKVKWHKTGDWTIYADSNGLNNFIRQGKVQDNTYSNFQYFGFECQFTSTRSDKFIFDAIYRGYPVIDTIPPKAKKVNLSGGQKVNIDWDEPITQSSLSQANIKLLPGNQAPSNRSFIKGLPSKTSLKFAAPFQNKTKYELIIDGFKDKQGNVVNDTIAFNYFKPQRRDLLINELLPDPSPSQGLPEHEFVEIYNNSNFPIDLSGWEISDANNQAVLKANNPLPPDSHAIITDKTNKNDFRSFGKLATVSGLPSLNNGGDQMAIANPDGDTINQVKYKDDWYDDPDKADGGWTLERINPLSPCQGAVNWGGSKASKGGTPGIKNSIANNTKDSIPPKIDQVKVLDSNRLAITLTEAGLKGKLKPLNQYFTVQPNLTLKNGLVVTTDSFILTFKQNFESGFQYGLVHSGVPDCWQNTINQPDSIKFKYYSPFGASAGDITFNELMPNPTPSKGLPEAEFVEIKNTSDQRFSLKNWQFKDAVSEVNLPDSVLKSGELGIICDDKFADQFKSYGLVLPVSNLPSLNNNGDELSLVSPGGEIIDSLTYSDSWYQESLKANGGWSLEQINPEHPCSGSDNWTGSKNQSGGTPGNRNSVYDPEPDETNPDLKKVNILDSTRLRITFSEKITRQSIQFDQWNIDPPKTIKDNNAKGNLVKHLEVTLASPLQNKTSYTLSIKGITDCWGNQAQSPIKKQFEYLSPKPSDRHELLITEIMPDPNPPVELPEAEYMELKNTSNKVLALQDHKLITKGNTKELPRKLLKPGEYVVLVRNASENDFSDSIPTVGVSGFPALNNQGGSLAIRNAGNDLVHAVSYDADIFGNSFKKSGGWSLELKDLNTPCSRPSNWAPSKNKTGGTPGFQNSVQQTNPDTRPPELLKVLVKDSNQLTVVFNEGMDSIAVTQGTYKVEPNTGIKSIKAKPPFFKEATITLKKPVKSGITYTVKVENVKDCSGNQIQKSQDRRFGLPGEPAKDDLMVNEILFDPPTGGADFVEFYNRSDKVIDLEDLRIATRNDSNKIESMTRLPDFQVLPGTYFVVTEDRPFVRKTFLVKKPLWLKEIRRLPTYPNESGYVVLAKKNGNVIDEVNYKEDWHSPLVDDPEGISLERITHEGKSNDKANWHSAAEASNFGTPTYENSQAGKEKTSEKPFKLEPKVFSPDQDGYKDFLSIIYRMEKPGYIANVDIYDTKGRQVKSLKNNHLLGRKGRFKWDGSRDNGQKAPKGAYIVYIEIFHPDGDQDSYKLTTTLGGNF